MSDEGKRRSQFLGWLILAVAVIGVAGTWFAFDPGFRKSTTQSSGSGNTGALDDFERRVRDYILNNPEIIVEAMQRLEERQRAAQTNELRRIIVARGDEIFRDPESPVGGNPAGDVTVVEFFDYNCPYCRRVAPTMIEAERADPRLRTVYKEFPILGPNSVFAAKAALASRNQRKYMEFHQALMQANGLVDEDKVLEVADATGIDTTRLRADMEGPAVAAAIERNLELARALRITGTPSFVVGDEILRGATDLSTLQALVDHAREREQGSATPKSR